MITAWRSSGESCVIAYDDTPPNLAPDIVWLDILSPSREEEKHAERLLGIELPTREDLKDIEPSSRLYSENNATYMTASLICNADSPMPVLTEVAFILTGERLVTIRYEEPRSFHLFAAAYGRVAREERTGPGLLVRLLETIVDRTAEILENSVAAIDNLSGEIFTPRNKDARRRDPRFLEQKLGHIAMRQRLLSKVRESLASMSRVLTFLYNTPHIGRDGLTRELCRSVSRDVQSLSEHASFIAANLTFLLDASLGLISVEQNAIIKIFSIASVVFLPPTLVASVYGMNFRVMPELEWAAGYPLALLAMVLSAIIPFFFFRWKGWL